MLVEGAYVQLAWETLVTLNTIITCPRLRGGTVQAHSFKFHKIILRLSKIASGAQDQCVRGSGVMFWFTAFWV